LLLINNKIENNNKLYLNIIMDNTLTFTKFNDFKNHCKNVTGCVPYSGVGIFHNFSHKSSILRSVDNTYYYDDNLNDVINPKYTLFGQVGDQCVFEKKYNKSLFDTNKIENIYLYRVKYLNNNKKLWIWYGKYEIVNYFLKTHIDKNYVDRTIIILNLNKISN
jgi:hypothetical protein